MFKGKNKYESPKTTASTTPPIDETSCIIAKGTVIEGTFSSTMDLRIDGIINGEVKSRKLVMGETGKIEGTVNCSESSIKGKIEGELNVRGLLHLLSSAFIKGKIRAKKMVVDEGASYSGECLIGEHHFKKEVV